ncbi:hypothetical protein PF006_g5367 [Phytophthora fragariae]|uniref:Uncharacterized protein n=1 Tax=Phytophthora fragariae TaxID=53985 RepID=A0A6A3UI70_9STRA|nr:hypothetical protein PF009_g6998 [Phytophthora fragariae]KAE9001721.1 hypothetical protein PF011_g13623 [Phytophthora fragariae]KAE9150239.1 hypothetical protein PF006_g5367 [Phytophthora fragariae]KAE9351811.1 hypothetical protein PF008_g5751 [Phytophthora fragariae]
MRQGRRWCACWLNWEGSAAVCWTRKVLWLWRCRARNEASRFRVVALRGPKGPKGLCTQQVAGATEQCSPSICEYQMTWATHAKRKRGSRLAQLKDAQAFRDLTSTLL